MARRISGLVVKSIVAIDGPRVRFAAGAIETFFFAFFFFSRIWNQGRFMTQLLVLGPLPLLLIYMKFGLVSFHLRKKFLSVMNVCLFCGATKCPKSEMLP